MANRCSKSTSMTSWPRKPCSWRPSRRRSSFGSAWRCC